MRSFVATAPLWLFALSVISSSDPGSSNYRQNGNSKVESVRTVYRGDMRSPKEIRSEGGFQPQGSEWHDISDAFAVDRHYLAGTGQSSEQELGVEYHTAYVSFARDQSHAVRHFDWFYEIHATQNILDPHNVHNYADGEVFALGGVRWSQVIRYQWYHDKNPVWISNPEYDRHLWEKSPIQGTQTRAPEELLDREETSWAKAEVREAARRYMNRPEMVANLGQFPFKFKSYPPRDDIPGPKPAPLVGGYREPGEFERRERAEFMDWLEKHCKVDSSFCELHAQPKAEGEPALPHEDDFLRLSDELASSEFEHLAIKYGVGKLIQRHEKVNLPQLRELSKADKALSASKTARASVWGARILSVPLLGLYVKDVVDVFFRDANTLDRVAVVTSIIPFVGCGAEVVANVNKGHTDLADATLCLVGDALLLTPAWPLGVVVHFSRFFVDVVRGLLQSVEVWERNELMQRRNQGWLAYVEEVSRYLESDMFGANIHTQYMTEMAAILGRASEARAEVLLGATPLYKGKSATKHQQKRITIDVKDSNKLLDRIICVDASLTKERLRRTFRTALDLWLLNQFQHHKNSFYREFRRQTLRKAGNPSGEMEERIDELIALTRSEDIGAALTPRLMDRLTRIVDGHIDNLETPHPCRTSRAWKRPDKTFHSTELVSA